MGALVVGDLLFYCRRAGAWINSRSLSQVFVATKGGAATKGQCTFYFLSRKNTLVFCLAIGINYRLCYLPRLSISQGPLSIHTTNPANTTSQVLLINDAAAVGPFSGAEDYNDSSPDPPDVISTSKHCD